MLLPISAFLLLFCVKRIQANETAARVSDVLREVIDVFARFDVLLCVQPPHTKKNTDVAADAAAVRVRACE